MNRSSAIACPWLSVVALLASCGDDGSAIDLGPQSTGAATDASTGLGSSSSDEGATSQGSSGDEPTADAVCGNQIVEGTEVCDGADLAGQTCGGLGLGTGELSCAEDCSAWVTSACSGPTNCGNGNLDPAEDCDAEDLGIGTCQSLGFAGGVLACAADCTYDTRECMPLSCGNEALDARDEDCDGGDLGGQDCKNLGFGAGELGCTQTCRFDTTGCCGDGAVGGAELCDAQDFGQDSCEAHGFDGGVLTCSETCDVVATTACTTCDDGHISGSEQCEGEDLGGQACSTIPGGFVGGPLACAADCSFDTSGCHRCGNGVIDAEENCDGAALGGQTCLARGFTGGALGCTAGCVYDEFTCTNYPAPTVGQVVITEIMQNPQVVTDAVGEWFEVYNPSEDQNYQLRGCVVEGGGAGESFQIDTDLPIGPQGFVTFAVTATPGFEADFVWPAGFGLNNASDTVRLGCAGGLVDEVSYDDGDRFPDPSGASMQVDRTRADADANDEGTHWCEGATDLGNGDFGSPGVTNHTCSLADHPIDWCGLVRPTTVNGEQGTIVQVYGRLQITGLTDLTAGNDPSPRVQAGVGYGPAGSNPAVGSSWVWTQGAAASGWTAVGPDLGLDEYVATMMLPGPGSYDYAYRFSGDGGASFTYCDAGNGSADGYSPADAGSLTTTSAAGVRVLFFSEVHEGASTYKAVEVYNPSDAAVSLVGCEIRQYFNGSVTSTDLPLAGAVGPRDVHVACSDAVTSTACDQRLNLLFNGDDALALSCDGLILDVFGRIGERPSSEWSNMAVGTADEDLRRLCSVTGGDPNGADAFDPSAQWASFALVDGVNYDDLGAHGCR